MATIYWGAEIRDHYKLKIGRGTIIGDHVILDARNGIEIGDNSNFYINVHIWTEQHDHRDPDFACNSSAAFKVTIRQPCLDRPRNYDTSFGKYRRGSRYRSRCSGD